jgi:hypothetical protein
MKGIEPGQAGWELDILSDRPCQNNIKQKIAEKSYSSLFGDSQPDNCVSFTLTINVLGIWLRYHNMAQMTPSMKTYDSCYTINRYVISNFLCWPIGVFISFIQLTMLE